MGKDPGKSSSNWMINIKDEWEVTPGPDWCVMLRQRKTVVLLQIAMVNPVTYTAPWKIASPAQSNKQWFHWNICLERFQLHLAWRPSCKTDFLSTLKLKKYLDCFLTCWYLKYFLGAKCKLNTMINKSKLNTMINIYFLFVVNLELVLTRVNLFTQPEWRMA